jgi:hypothetical protein
MNSETNDLISYIHFQDDNCDIINIFIYTQQNNKKYNTNNRSNLKKLNIKPYRRCPKQSECCICCQDIKKTEYIRELNCNHQFHKKCIDKWLLCSMKSNEHVNCPICRTIIHLI